MRKIVHEVQLTERELNDLEKAFYEYDMFKDNMTFILSTHGADPGFFESDLYKSLEEKQLKVNRAFVDARDFVTNHYIPEEFNSKKYVWEADFKNYKLLITE